MFAGLGRQQRTYCCRYEQRLPWRRTEEAAPQIEELGLLVLHIAGVVLGIALCWCWQCLLTVGGNLLPYIVTSLDVTTVAWCCRRNQDVLHPAESSRRVVQTSEWQWTASVFTTWHCTGSCSSLFAAHKCFQRYLTACYGCWTGVTEKCVRWYSVSW